jgi:hypothetical protein
MGKYGLAAVRAAHLVNSKKFNSPMDAWSQATIEIFGEGTTSQVKGCRKSAFLGLCDEGFVHGIRKGRYSTRSNSKNKEYAIKAVDLIKMDPQLVNDMKGLWNKVKGGAAKVHNSQMDVVIMLWQNNLLVV